MTAALHFVAAHFGACWVAGWALVAVAIVVLHYECREPRP